MQLTTPDVGWIDVNEAFSTLDIADYRVNLFITETGRFAWQLFRGGKLICTDVADDQGDARDAAEDTIRHDFDARHEGV